MMQNKLFNFMQNVSIVIVKTRYWNIPIRGARCQDAENRYLYCIFVWWVVKCAWIMDASIMDIKGKIGSD